jgi:hypothetical protein
MCRYVNMAAAVPGLPSAMASMNNITTRMHSHTQRLHSNTYDALQCICTPMHREQEIGSNRQAAMHHMVVTSAGPSSRQSSTTVFSWQHVFSMYSACIAATGALGEDAVGRLHYVKAPTNNHARSTAINK